MHYSHSCSMKRGPGRRLVLVLFMRLVPSFLHRGSPQSVDRFLGAINTLTVQFKDLGALLSLL